MASYSSYNLLKAAADGLADAINYRTNLKRKRRENEYDYQRDLQRAREEHAYDRALALKENEEDYKIKTDRAIKEEQDKIARTLGYIEKAPKAQDIDFYSPVSVYGANDVRGAYGLTPWSVQRKPETLEDKLAKMDREYEHKENLARIRAAGRGGGRQPSLTPYEKLQHDLSMARTPEEREMILQLHRVAPRAVKGGSGKGEKEYDPYTANFTTSSLKDINELYYKYAQHILNNRPEKAEFARKVAEIMSNDKYDDKLKKQAIDDLRTSLEEDVKAGDSVSALLLSNILSIEKNLSKGTRYKTNNKYDYDRKNREIIEVEPRTASDTAAIDARINFVEDEDNKSKELGRRTTMGSGQTVFPQQQTLYSDGTASNSAVLNQPEQMPTDIKPLAVRQFSPNEDVFITGRTPADMNLPVGYEMAVERLQSDWMNKRISFEEYNRGLELLNNRYFGGTI